MADLTSCLKVFVVVCVRVNPLEGAPAFLVWTQTFAEEQRQMIAQMAALGVTAMVLVSLADGLRWHLGEKIWCRPRRRGRIIRWGNREPRKYIVRKEKHMSPIEFEQVLKTQPFVPVRLHMSNGRTHEFRHPDNAIVGEEVVAIGVYEDGRDRPLIRLLSLININEIEPLSIAR
jgi:hypothetical protein